MPHTHTPETRHEVKISIPDMGLSKDQIEHLKRQFESTIIGNMGGPQA